MMQNTREYTVCSYRSCNERGVRSITTSSSKSWAERGHDSRNVQYSRLTEVDCQDLFSLVKPVMNGESDGFRSIDRSRLNGVLYDSDVLLINPLEHSPCLTKAPWD